jgi:hypothetical protein
MDMRFYWIRDRTQQGQFHVFWAPGRDNLADYFTKHHAPAHHRLMRPVYLHEPTSKYSSIQRGCVEIATKGTRTYVRPPTVDQTGYKTNLSATHQKTNISNNNNNNNDIP